MVMVHVKAHSRTLASGKVIHVPAHSYERKEGERKERRNKGVLRPHLHGEKRRERDMRRLARESGEKVGRKRRSNVGRRRKEYIDYAGTGGNLRALFDETKRRHGKREHHHRHHEYVPSAPWF